MCLIRVAVYTFIFVYIFGIASSLDEPVVYLRSSITNKPSIWSRNLGYHSDSAGKGGRKNDVEEEKATLLKKFPSFWVLTFRIDTLHFPSLYTKLQIFSPVSYIPTSSYVVYLHNSSQYHDIIRSDGYFPTLVSLTTLPSTAKSVWAPKPSDSRDERQSTVPDPVKTDKDTRVKDKEESNTLSPRRLFLERRIAAETSTDEGSSSSAPGIFHSLTVHRGLSKRLHYTSSLPSSTVYKYTKDVQTWMDDILSRLHEYLLLCSTQKELSQIVAVSDSECLGNQDTSISDSRISRTTIQRNSTQLLFNLSPNTYHSTQYALSFRTIGRSSSNDNKSSTTVTGVNEETFFLHFSMQSVGATGSISGPSDSEPSHSSILNESGDGIDKALRSLLLFVHDWLIEQTDVLWIEYYSVPHYRNAFSRPLVLSTDPGEYDRSDIEYGICNVQSTMESFACYNDPILETFDTQIQSTRRSRSTQPLFHGNNLRSWLNQQATSAPSTKYYKRKSSSSTSFVSPSILTEWFRDQLTSLDSPMDTQRTSTVDTIIPDYTDFATYVNDVTGSNRLINSFISEPFLQNTQASCNVDCIQAKCNYGFDDCYREHGWSIFYDKNITGKNQLIHVVDSGIDISHPLFYDPFFTDLSKLFTKNWTFPLANHRKIAMIYAMSDTYDSLNGHGTHVAGTIAGTTYSNLDTTTDSNALDAYYSLLPFSGMAPDARFILVDFCCDYGDTNNGICTCPAQLEHTCYCDTDQTGNCIIDSVSIPTYEPFVYEAGYQNGARISSNSWGPPDGIVTPFYSSVSMDHDSWIYNNHQDMLVIFAASNDGDVLDENNLPNFASISMQASAKNVLTIGAIRNTIDNRMFNLLSYLSPTDKQSCTGLSLTAAEFIARSELPLNLPICTANSCLTLAAATPLVSNGGFSWDLALCCNCSVYTIMEEAITIGLDPITVVTEGLTNYMARWRAQYSSVGPTLDGRIKPDLMAVGSDIFSSRSTLKNATLMSNPFDFRCAASTSISTMDSPPFPPLSGQSGIRTVNVIMSENIMEPVFLSSIDILVGPSTTATKLKVRVNIYENSHLLAESVTLVGIVGTGSGILTEPMYVNVTVNMEVPKGTMVTLEIVAYPNDQFMDLLVPDPPTNSSFPVCFGETYPSIGLIYNIENGNPLPSYLSLKSGTSMATPSVAGIAALVRQYFTDGFYNLNYPLDDTVTLPVQSNGFHPSAALLKAILINSASPLLLANTVIMSTLSSQERAGVNITRSQIVSEMGFGAVNLIRGISLPYMGKDIRRNGDIISLILPGLSLQPFSNNRPIPEPSSIIQQGIDPQLNHHQLHIYCLDVQARTDIAELTSTLPLSVTLVWTDPPGSPLSFVALVNNLDLEIITPSGTLVRGNEDLDYSVNTMSAPTSSGKNTAAIADDRNNVEKATFAIPTYTLAANNQRIAPMYTIIVRGTLIPQGPQAYSLVITGPNLHQTVLPDHDGTCSVYPIPGFDALSPYDSTSSGSDVNGILNQLGSLTEAVTSAEGATGGLGAVLALLVAGYGANKLRKNRQGSKRKPVFSVTQKNPIQTSNTAGSSNRHENGNNENSTELAPVTVGSSSNVATGSFLPGTNGSSSALSSGSGNDEPWKTERKR